MFEEGGAEGIVHVVCALASFDSRSKMDVSASMTDRK
jgi:hypothetical protein